jgi:hypothetical protein
MKGKALHVYWDTAVGIILVSAECLGQQVVFMEPLGKIDTNTAEVHAEGTVYRVVDGARYRPWLENESARRALALYKLAFAVLTGAGNAQRQPAAYHIALVPGGNHAAVGFRIQTEAAIEDHDKQAYILLDPDPRSFETTLLHETGHVVMHMLSGGQQLPAADVCSIPHTTAALTDRMTAFSEGWAIHLEALAAHLAASDELRRTYHRAGALFGDVPYRESEYFLPAADVASYAQNFARYQEVRENAYAFQSAFKQSGYLRAQLDKARDMALVRDANQLLQSEGFYASFFFLFAIRGPELPSEPVVAAREENMLQTLAAMFARVKPEADTPWLVEFVRSYMESFPRERDEIVQVLNDLSRGVFVDSQAAALWRNHYLAALKLDLKNLNRETIAAKRREWNTRVARNPQVLSSPLGPQVPCLVSSVLIKVEAFGEAQPLLFDLNTAEEGVLRSVPSMSDELLQRWTEERAKRPFASLADFKERVSDAPACR